MADLKHLHKEYGAFRLDIDNLATDPILLFRNWLNEAIKSGVSDPGAMVLSTATPDGRSSSRVVLLKNLDVDGFTFFTNYESKKGIQIKANPYGSLLFFWPLLERQVRIEGKLFRSPRHESDEYFRIRPEGSRIGAWSSPQSRRIPSREYIESLQKDYMELFKTRVLDRPENWGGYKLVPHLVEFWQGRENRLHDRFEYVMNNGGWEVYRLAP